MRLADELLACGVAEPVDEFRERLIQRLTDWFPGRSIDGLVCEPTDSLRYCNDIRAEVDSDVLFDAVILKALMNLRKQKSCPTGLSGRSPRRNVKNELQAAGCELEPGAFKELLSDCLADMYKNRTTDEVVCHPREAKALCNYVRSRADCDALSDDFILSTLMNVRKAINT